VDEDPAATDLDSECRRAGDHVGEEGGAESSAFVGDVDAESGKQRDCLRVTACTVTQPRWRVGNANAGHAPRVVGDDIVAAPRRDDEHLAGFGRVGLARLPSEPLTLLVVAPEAVEPIEGFEQPGWGVARVTR
jgi:hypothetical protein